MVKGTVTISIDDYHALLDATTTSLKVKDNSNILIKELQVFLSFLCTRENIEKYVGEFNKQSKTSQILIDGGIARIKKKDEPA